MTASSFQLYKTIAVIGSFVVAVVLQMVLPLSARRLASTKNWHVNVPLAGLNTMLVAAVCGSCVYAISVLVASRQIGLFNWLGLSSPLFSTIGSVFVLDVAAWAWHVANHRLAFLWRFHAVHHSDNVYDASTAVRFHIGEIALSTVVRLAVVAVFGLPLSGVLAFEVVYAFFNFFAHGSIALPKAMSRAVAALCITPGLHRQHHAVCAEDLNSNFGTIFSLWDRCFGTLSQRILDPCHPVGLIGLSPWIQSISGLLKQPFTKAAGRA